MRVLERGRGLAVALAMASCGGGAGVVAPPVGRPARGAPSARAADPPGAVRRPIISPLYEERFEDPQRKAKLLRALGAAEQAARREAATLGSVGTYVAVIVDGEVVHRFAMGRRRLDDPSPVTPQTVFRVASITKPIVATAVFMLREQGELSLDDPVTRYVPEASQIAVPRADAATLRIRHLLTHRGGFPRDFVAPPRTEAQLLQALSEMHHTAAPDADYAYSNVGYALLGVVVSRASGVPFDRFLDERLFEPLGLRSAAWSAKDVPADRLAVGHATADGAELRPDFTELGVSGAYGGLFFSGDDLARWVSWHLDAHPARAGADDGPLSRAGRRAMHQLQGMTDLYVKAPDGRPWFSDAKAWSTGLGFHGWQSCDFDPVVFADGKLDHQVSEVALLPDHGVGVVVSSNSDRFVRRVVFAVLEELRASGGLSRRRRVRVREPATDAIADALVNLHNDWNDAVFDRKLGASDVARERAQAELGATRERHGRCRRGPIVGYHGPSYVRYQLECDRGALELLVTTSSPGKPRGFLTFSMGTSELPATRDAAQRLLEAMGRKDRAALAKLFVGDAFRKHGVARFADDYARYYGPCELGEAIEQDGNGFQKFGLRCRHGRTGSLPVRLDARGRLNGAFLFVDPVDKCEQRSEETD